MANVYESCLTFEDKRFFLRSVKQEDADERINAAQRSGFTKSEKLLIGTNDHYAYNNYRTINKERSL